MIIAAKDNKVIPFVGLSLFLLVDILSFHSSTAFSGVSGFVPGFYTPVLIFSRILAFVGVAIVSTRMMTSKTKRPVIALSCALFSTAAMLLIAFGAPSIGTSIVMFGAMILGASQGVASLFWLSTLTAFDYRGSYLYLLAGHALATVLCALLLLLPFSLVLPVTIACTVLSNTLLVFAPQGVVVEHSITSRGLDVAQNLGKAVATVCVFALASGVMISVASNTTSAIEPAYEQYTVLGISGLVLVIMFIPALVFKQPLKLENGYKVALPLSALGFLVLPGLTELIPTFIAGTLTTTGYMVTGIILSCLIAEMARTARMSPVSLLSVAESITLAFLLLGLMIGGMFSQYLGPEYVSLALIALGLLYLLALGTSWFFSRDKEEGLYARSERKSSAQDAVQSLELDKERLTQKQVLLYSKQTLAEIAESLSFSEQEQQVFYQLVEGRTLSRIAQDLYLSVSSVKYHTQKIYRAFDVHSRSELNEALSRVEPPADVRIRQNSKAAGIAADHGLSKRETEVMQLLAQGETMADIALALSISENTTRTYIKRVYSKLDIHSKQDIIDLCR